MTRFFDGAGGEASLAWAAFRLDPDMIRGSAVQLRAAAKPFVHRCAALLESLRADMLTFKLLCLPGSETIHQYILSTPAISHSQGRVMDVRCAD